MAAPIITPTNKSAGFQATDLFSTIFSVTGSVTSYNVALAGPNDGTVTGGPTVTPGVVTNVTPPQFNAMSFVGALNAGTDTLYLQAVGSGGTSAWVAATLTDTGAIVANPTSLEYTQPAVLSSQLFTVSGAITSYNVYLASPSDGTVTGGNHTVVAGVITEENNLSGMNFIGGLTPGADTLYLQAVTAQGTSNWVPVTVTDTGAIFSGSQFVAYNQSLSLDSAVRLSGVDNAITGFNLYLASPNDGTIAGVTPGVVTTVTRALFNTMNFVGGVSAGTDTLYAQAITAGGAGNWVTVTLTDTGAITANTGIGGFLSINYNSTSQLFGGIFSVPNNNGITGYNVYLASPADGSITGGNQVNPGVITPETPAQFAALNFVGSGVPGTDTISVQPITASGPGAWVTDTINNPGVAPDVLNPNPNSFFYGQTRSLSTLFFAGGNSPSQYQVYLPTGNDGTIPGVTPGVVSAVLTSAQFASMNFVGGIGTGTDMVSVRAFDGQWSNWATAAETDQGVFNSPNYTFSGLGYTTTLALTQLFGITSAGPITGYNVYLAPGNDGTVTGGAAGFTPGVVTPETLAQYNAMSFVGGGAPGTDNLYVQAVDGAQTSNWVRGIVIEPGVPPDTVTATTPLASVAYTGTAALSSLFTVGGGHAVSQYQVYLATSNDGTITGGATVTPGVAATETPAQFAALNFVGGIAAGTDTVSVRAFDGQWSDWTSTTVADQGSIISVSPVLPYATAFPLSGIFLTLGGGSITGYNLYLDSPNNGTVTGTVNPVVPGVVAHETSLTGNFVYGIASATDTLWLQAVNAQGASSNWVSASLNSLGAVVASNPTVDFGHSVPLSSIFAIFGSPTSYNGYLAGPNDGTVTGGAPVTPGVAVNGVTPTQFAAMHYNAGSSAGTDQLWLQAVNGSQMGTWKEAVLTDVASGGSFAPTGSGAAANASTLVYTGESNQTFLDTAAIYNDTVIGFSDADGDRIHLTTDTVSDALAHSTQVNGGADTLISLSDSSTILLKGITHIGSGFFA